jgi:hypothetical protein
MTKAMNIWDKIPGLVKLLIIYAVLNGVIYGAQELYYYGDTKKMNQLKSEMNNIQNEVATLESRATNGELAEPYYSRYQSNIDQYNKKVDEYNTLNEKSGSRWWLIPIPIGHGSINPK